MLKKRMSLICVGGKNMNALSGLERKTLWSSYIEAGVQVAKQIPEAQLATLFNFVYGCWERNQKLFTAGNGVNINGGPRPVPPVKNWTWLLPDAGLALAGNKDAVPRRPATATAPVSAAMRLSDFMIRPFCG